ncbi:hypothetical protein CPB97_005356, partial [Podila verticillata]
MDHPSVSQSNDLLIASTTDADMDCPFASSNSNNNDSNLPLHPITNAQGDLIDPLSFRRSSDATFESASTMVLTGLLDEKAKGLEGKMRKISENDEELLTISQESLRDDREGGVSTCVVGGTGTLGMPHAVAQSGWVGAVIILLALFMSTYTGIILIECLYLKT